MADERDPRTDFRYTETVVQHGQTCVDLEAGTCSCSLGFNMPGDAPKGHTDWRMREIHFTGSINPDSFDDIWLERTGGGGPINDFSVRMSLQDEAKRRIRYRADEAVALKASIEVKKVRMRNNERGAECVAVVSLPGQEAFTVRFFRRPDGDKVFTAKGNHPHMSSPLFERVHTAAATAILELFKTGEK